MKKIVSFLIILIFVFISIESFACPHYDENGDEFYWLFNEDETSRMLYIHDHYDRVLHLDYDYNFTSEEFVIPLIYDDRINLLNKLNKINVSNYHYSFDVEVNYLLPKNEVKLINSYFAVFFHIEVTALNQIFNESKRNKIVESIKDYEFLENTIFQTESSLEFEYKEKDKKNKKIVVNEYDKPILFNVDLKEYSLTDKQIEGVCGLHIKQDHNGNLIPVKIKGSYNKNNHIFSFHMSEPGYYGVFIDKENKDTPVSKEPAVVITEEAEGKPTEKEELKPSESENDAILVVEEPAEEEIFSDDIIEDKEIEFVKVSEYAGNVDLRIEDIDTDLENNQNKLNIVLIAIAFAIVSGFIVFILRWKKRKLN